MSPVIVAGTVYAGSGQGTLYALDAKTGTQLWSDTVGSPFANATFIGDPLGQIGAGEGMLIAPAGTHLFAYAHSDAALDAGASDADADGAMDAR